MTRPQEYVDHPNVGAFLHAIRLGEGTSDELGYRRIVGGDLFDSFADHPRTRVWIDRYKVWSTAAGAYQFIASTWDEMRRQYALPDFSPRSQDLAAVGLLIRRRALEAVLAGRIEDAIRLCRQEWASLPGSPYGQRTESLERVLAEYARWGGQLVPVEAPEAVAMAAPEPAPAPIEESYPIITKEAPVSPIIAAVLPSVVQAIPELAKILGSGSQVATRNAEAAERVVQIVTEATDSVNVQQAAERVIGDPAARASAQAAIRREYFDLIQMSEKSVADARAFAKEWADGEPFIRSAWLHIRFVELLSLLLVMLAATGGYLVLTGDGYSPEIKASVVTLILIGGFTAVVTFWLGSSRDSQRKTGMLGK